MELSVVVSTLNDREQLVSSLDVLTDRTPSSTEIIVVNGPSSDGTTGVVREREDVDVLVEISERNTNVSRNAGLEVASSDVIAFLDGRYAIERGWYEAVENAITAGADIVTGPISGVRDAISRRPREIDGQTVTLFDCDNVAFDSSVLEALDGFDEYLSVDGSRDCAHRVSALGFDVTCEDEMAIQCDVETDGGRREPDWGTTYRSLSYRLAKNDGPRPTVVGRIGASALRDGVSAIRTILSGESTPTGWFDDGISVTKNLGSGFIDGVRARYADRSLRRNPNGLSVRHDRAVQVYDRRDTTAE
ncbi:glycosyl transferase family 2 [Halostagnicola larsenii XH-48]|uniref:Glycosyl transferase family 2 n=1 Tax=Halostagnicola larsenii XH-48 TaxID=797299 RepID=W0JJ53_9EURY|nr:glycosyltransferase [Halostagnicola larsenii]AHF98765.1 glycosyl transferase family 2 [Halostagnicola larsenii XH-48]